MSAIDGFVIIDRDPFEIRGLRRLEAIGDGLLELTLIAFDREHLVPTRRNDLLGKVLPTAHGIDGHDAAFEFH